MPIILALFAAANAAMFLATLLFSLSANAREQREEAEGCTL